MSGIDVGEEMGARAAQARALALLRIRSRALAVAILPAAVAVVLFAADAQGHLAGPAWDAVRWTVLGVAVVVLLVTVLVAVSVARARPAMSPTVPVPEEGAPDLYRLVRDLADRLDVPAPSAIALTPDCDSWLEDRTHRALRRGPGASLRKGPGAPAEAADTAPVLVIGSPFLWWMRVAELRAVLAPVVAGTGPSAHPDIAAARRFVRGLDAAIADAAVPGRGPVRGAPLAFAGWVARLLLRACRGHAAEMERCVAAAASMRAQTVDYGLRIAAQEQVGLAYAGWDRLLTRVALPAWRMGRWPSRLDAGVVSALTELSRRDRLADGFALRLGERPACDLLEEPGVADEAASLLAARLFHGGPAESGPGWAPVDWQQYPDEVVDRKWRSEAARLHRVLDTLGVPRASAADPAVPTLARVMEHLAGPGGPGGPGEALAAGIGAAVAREEAEAPGHGGPGAGAAGSGPADDPLDLWGPGPLPLFPLQPPRTGTELLADHVAAMVCCAAVDTAGAAPGLDWLDGPALLVGGERRADLAAPVLSLVEDGDPDPLLSWLAEVGVRSDKPVRLV
ncbi:M48 family metalloprotease [Streptomyces rubiginosohelvolus]|uniref:Integral membrane protein n=1 Tax=Streptomyces rubiginosohelvolus TaxID=67362 RepID=A0ABW6F310_9ACTN